MSILVPYGESIEILRPAAKGQFGDPVTDVFGDQIEPTPNVVEGCALWPQDGNATAANETMFQQDTVIIGYACLCPPGTDIRSTDQVSYQGSTWDVTGEPVRERSMLTGTDAGVLVSLRRVKG